MTWARNPPMQCKIGVAEGKAEWERCQYAQSGSRFFSSTLKDDVRRRLALFSLTIIGKTSCATCSSQGKWIGCPGLFCLSFSVLGDCRGMWQSIHLRIKFTNQPVLQRLYWHSRPWCWCSLIIAKVSSSSNAQPYQSDMGLKEKISHFSKYFL